MALLIRTLEAQSVEDQCAGQRSERDTSSDKIKGDGVFATRTAEGFKFAPAQFSDVTSLSALASRRFAGSDLATESEIHPFDLTRVNRASMVTAGSGSSPRVNALSGEVNAHGVAGFDRLNAIPANLNTLDGVGDADSFIKDFNLGMDEEQVGDRENKNSPRTCDEVSFDRTHCKGLNNKSENNDRRYASREPRATRSIENDITHPAIFSQHSGLEG
jgi:hypothetical protein